MGVRVRRGRRKGRRGGVLWVHWHKARETWQVSVKLEGGTFFVGSFKGFVDAVVARNFFLQVKYGGLGEAWRLRRRKRRALRVALREREVEPPREEPPVEREEKRAPLKLLGTLEEILRQAEGKEKEND